MSFRDIPRSEKLGWTPTQPLALGLGTTYKWIEPQVRASRPRYVKESLDRWDTRLRVRLSNLRPSTRSISLLPVSLLERIKIAANKRDVPYQSLIKMWLAEKADVG